MIVLDRREWICPLEILSFGRDIDILQYSINSLNQQNLMTVITFLTCIFSEPEKSKWSPEMSKFSFYVIKTKII